MSGSSRGFGSVRVPVQAGVAEPFTGISFLCGPRKLGFLRPKVWELLKTPGPKDNSEPLLVTRACSSLILQLQLPVLSVLPPFLSFLPWLRCSVASCCYGRCLSCHGPRGRQLPPISCCCCGHMHSSVAPPLLQLPLCCFSSLDC